MGASIGLAAHGLRIFDQFGAAQDILDQTVPMTYSRPHRRDGALIAAPQPIFTLLEPRLGYGFSFLDRQLVLRSAAKTIRQKHKILLNKRMKGIDHTSTGVSVHCEDGTSYDGDMVIGADGVNSKVRQEMWRIADQEDPEYFSVGEKLKMTAEYRCLFGISDPVPGLESPGFCDLCYDKAKSFLVITGKDKRIYWFYFEKLDKVYKHSEPDFPRYTRADAEKVAADNLDRKFHETLTLGDLWKTKITCTLVPMEEALFNKWSWGRIATIGDCAHKMTANHGQAGNSAIESAASLANQLYALNAAQTRSLKPLNTSEVTSAFKKWQAKRQARIEATCKEAALVCRYSVLDSIMAYVFHYVLVPNSQSLLINMQCGNMIGAELLEWLPVPPRSLEGTMGFNRHQGTARGESTLLRALKASPLLLLSWFVWHNTPDSQTYFDDRMRDVLHPAGVDSEQILRIVTFGVCEIMLFALRDLESGRRANALNLFLRLPTIFAVAAQVYGELSCHLHVLSLANVFYTGVGVVMPVYFFLHYLASSVDAFAAADMRLMNVAYIRSILPSLLLMFANMLIPIVFGMSFDADDSSLKAMRLLAPVGLLATQMIASRLSKDTEEHNVIHNCVADLVTIRRTVKGMIGLAAIVFAYQSDKTSWTTMFDFSIPQMDILDWNHFGLVHAGVLWISLLFWDLCRAGMASITKTLTYGALYLVLHEATPHSLRPLVDMSLLLLAWLAREEILATKKERHAITLEKYGDGKSVLEVEGGVAVKRLEENRNGYVEKDATVEKFVIGHLKKANGVPKAIGVEMAPAVATF